MIRHSQEIRLGHAIEAGTLIGKVDYHKLVEALGGKGMFVEKPAEIRPALEEAFASGRTTCINVMTDPTTVSPGSVALANLGIRSMTRMTASEALVETLVAEEVEVVFGIVGSAYMDALDLFPAAGIRFVSVAHEQAAAHAADGLARVTGRPQVCIAQNGPGAANFVSATTAAFWAHSPVVVITPEAWGWARAAFRNWTRCRGSRPARNTRCA
jgi:thiamine pyrophosphate-dependent acetolactate synthase large subunit-like protein